MSAVQYSTGKSAYSWYDKLELLAELPKELRYEVAYAMHGGAAKSTSFFQEKDPAFVAAILPLVRDELVVADETIYKEGDYAAEIYFLTKGQVQFVDGEKKRVYKALHQGAYFGDVELIRDTARKYTVVAGTDCHLLTLHRKVTITQFLGLIQRDFPLIWEEMKEVAEKRDSINEKARNEFRALISMKTAGHLDSLSSKQIREKLASYNPLTREKDTSLSDVSEGLTMIESTLTQLEDDLSTTNATIEEAIKLLKSRRSLKTLARLDPIDAGPRSETPCKSTLPTEQGRDGDESGRCM